MLEMDQRVEKVNQTPDNILFVIERCFIQRDPGNVCRQASLNLHSSFATLAALYFLGSAPSHE